MPALELVLLDSIYRRARVLLCRVWGERFFAGGERGDISWRCLSNSSCSALSNPRIEISDPAVSWCSFFYKTMTISGGVGTLEDGRCIDETITSRDTRFARASSLHHIMCSNRCTGRCTNENMREREIWKEISQPSLRVERTRARST